MNKKNITPHPQQPVDRKPAGKLPEALAELGEEALSGANVVPQQKTNYCGPCLCSQQIIYDVGLCSYDGDDD